jgi:hypothetical protein
MKFTNMRKDVLLMASNNWDVFPERYIIIYGCKIRYLDYNSHDNKSEIIYIFSYSASVTRNWSIAASATIRESSLPLPTHNNNRN